MPSLPVELSNSAGVGPPADESEDVTKFSLTKKQIDVIKLPILALQSSF